MGVKVLQHSILKLFCSPINFPIYVSICTSIWEKGHHNDTSLSFVLFYIKFEFSNADLNRLLIKDTYIIARKRYNNLNKNKVSLYLPYMTCCSCYFDVLLCNDIIRQLGFIISRGPSVFMRSITECCFESLSLSS